MGRGWGRECVEVVENAAIRVREEVTVEVERDADRRVTHLRLEVLRCAPAATMSAAKPLGLARWLIRRDPPPRRYE
jgi:hypothetical protein